MATVAVIAISFISALTARYNLSVIPWFTVLRKPRLSGSTDEFRRLWTHLFGWIVVSACFALIAVYLLQYLSFFSQYISEVFNIGDSDGGGVGIFASTFFTTWIYMFLVRKTRYLLKKQSERLPKELLGESEKYDTPSKKKFMSMGSLDLSSNGLVPASLRAGFYYVPRLLTVPYRYFYEEVDHLVNGSARLLLDKYGPEQTLGFFQRHIHNHENENLTLTRDKLVEKGLEGHELAIPLLIWKIKSRGFFLTRNYIDHYILDVPSKRYSGPDKRKSLRLPLVDCKPLLYITGGRKLSGHLSEYSEDGVGWFVATDAPINVSSRVKFEIDNNIYEALVAHTNILTSRDNHNVGFAIHVDDAEAQKKLLKLCVG